MLYIVAIICPPLAVLLTGRLFTAIVTFFLWMCFIFPGAIVAILVVASHNANRRNDALIGQLRSGQRQTGFATEALIRQNRMLHDQNRMIHEALLRQAHAAEYQAYAASEMLRRQHIAATVSQPSPPPLPTPFVDIDDADSLLPPVPPPSIGERIPELIARAKQAYAELPEWGQPVVWGMAAATPVVVLMFTVWLLR